MFGELSSSALLFALLGGIVPAVLWLLFWLREDKLHPEPRGLIMLAFLAGMIAVAFVIPIEVGLKTFFGGTMLVALWAITEEFLKFLFAYLFVLRNKAVNEPVDVVIYMITVALGFAAFENTLFLLSPLADGFVIESIITGNLRFIGATLIHTLSSATIGVALAFSFYKSKISREFALFIGLILASILHTLFNFFILKSDGNGGLLETFLVVWFGIIVLILLFEKIKQIRNPHDTFIKQRK